MRNLALLPPCDIYLLVSIILNREVWTLLPRTFIP